MKEHKKYSKFSQKPRRKPGDMKEKTAREE
jgi:hypothetical protein